MNKSSRIIKRSANNVLRYRKRYKKKGFLARHAGKAKYIPYILKSVGILKGLINAENHMFDTQLMFSPPNTGTVFYLSNIGQGNSNGTRIGNSILAKYLHIQLSVKNNSLATGTVTRVLILCDKTNSGTLPAASDILTQVQPQSPLKEINADRFVTIYSWLVGTSNVGNTTEVDDSFRRLNFHIKYNGALSTDNGVNSLICLMISDQGTNTPNIVGNIRMGFYDN